MSQTAYIAGPRSSEDVKGVADICTDAMIERAEDSLEIDGETFCLFSEKSLHQHIKSVISLVTDPPED